MRKVQAMNEITKKRILSNELHNHIIKLSITRSLNGAQNIKKEFDKGIISTHPGCRHYS